MLPTVPRRPRIGARGLFIDPARIELDEGVLFQVIGINIRPTDAKVELRLARSVTIRDVPESWTGIPPVIETPPLDYQPRPIIAPIDIGPAPLIENPEPAPGWNARIVYVKANRDKQLSRFSTWTSPKTDRRGSQVRNAGYLVGGNIRIPQYHLNNTATGTYSLDDYSLSGTSLGNVATGTVTALNATVCITTGCTNIGAAFQRRASAGDSASPVVSAIHYQQNTVQSPVSANSTYFYAIDEMFCYLNGYLYALGGNTTAHLGRWPAPGGSATTATPDVTYILDPTGSATAYSIVASNDGFIYVVGPDPTDISKDALFKFSQALTLLRTWHASTGPGGAPFIPTNLKRNNGFAVIDDYLICQNFVGAATAFCYRLQMNGSWKLINSVACQAGNFVGLDSSYLLVNDGVLLLS